MWLRVEFSNDSADSNGDLVVEKIIENVSQDGDAKEGTEGLYDDTDIDNRQLTAKRCTSVDTCNDYDNLYCVMEINDEILPAWVNEALNAGTLMFSPL